MLCPFHRLVRRWTTIVETEFVITRRYMTEEEASAEAKAIIGKQNRVMAKLRKLVDAEAEEEALT
jgi:uncharacterized protein YktB (UPF0637 family)